MKGEKITRTYATHGTRLREAMGVTGQEYKAQRGVLQAFANKRLAYFNECWHKEAMEGNKTACHVWHLRTGDGNIAVISPKAKTKEPRFGVAKFEPEGSPTRDRRARRYIYAKTYPHSPLWKHVRLRMLPECHELCVNPEHMYPRPKKED